MTNSSVSVFLNSDMSVLLLVCIAAIFVTRANVSDRLKKAKELLDSLDTDRRKQTMIAFSEVRKKYMYNRVVFLLIFVLVIKFLHQYYVLIGVSFIIYSFTARTIFIYFFKRKLFMLNLPKSYIAQIINANKLSYIASLAFGFIVMQFTAYYHYSL